MRYKTAHAKRKTTHYSVWHLRFTALLGCLTLISVYFLSGVYSKFFTTVQGNGTAKVAYFSPSVVSDKIIEVADAEPGYVDEVAFRVQNFSDEKASEVAMRYRIVLKTTGNIPLTFTLLNDSGTAVATWECNGTSGACEYTYTDSSLVFSVGTRKTDAYQLQLEWPNANGKNDARFSGMTDAVYLSAEFEQID